MGVSHTCWNRLVGSILATPAAAASMVEWACQNDGAGAPFKARGALPGPLVGSQKESWGRRDPQTRSPVSNVPTTEGVGTQRTQGAAK